ncbi:hypothetical protein [Nostoc sp.]|uniref:hypothetical protein n=1 Tax=Nostoc sp. TaxID=1180 RepID=UPI002FF7E111
MDTTYCQGIVRFFDQLENGGYHFNPSFAGAMKALRVARRVHGTITAAIRIGIGGMPQLPNGSICA